MGVFNLLVQRVAPLRCWTSRPAVARFSGRCSGEWHVAPRGRSDRVLATNLEIAARRLAPSGALVVKWPTMALFLSGTGFDLVARHPSLLDRRCRSLDLHAVGAGHRDDVATARSPERAAASAQRQVSLWSTCAKKRIEAPAVTNRSDDRYRVGGQSR